jgi:hypothetical protein
MIQPIMLQLAARVAAAVQMLVFQMVRRVTLVVTLQLRVMLVEATPSIKVAHILQVVAVVQVLQVLTQQVHQPLAMAVREQLILSLVLQ